MATMIERLTGITIRSPYFSAKPTLVFFPEDKETKRIKRAALMFGHNGSGKSTIAKGFREYVDATTPRSVEIEPVCGKKIWTPHPDAQPEKIFVFDETYIERSVKIRSDGLDAIVLFGEQVQLEQQIQELDKEIEQLEIQLQQQEKDNEKYSDRSDPQSPLYWIGSLTKILKRPGGWSETLGMKINGRKTNAPVNDAEIDRIGRLAPEKTEEATRKEFNRAFSIFSGVDDASTKVDTEIKQIPIKSDLENHAETMLKSVLQRPFLTARETELLQLFGIKAVGDSKVFLSEPSHQVCPTCLQPISEDYRKDMMVRIEKILNSEVDAYCQDLQKLLLQEIPVSSYDIYREIDRTAYLMVIDSIHRARTAITAHNLCIQSKIDDPFTPMEYDRSIRLLEAFQSLNAALSKLEAARQSYNAVVDDRKKTAKYLQRLLDDLAHYQIADAYASLCKQRDAQEKDAGVYRSLKEKSDELDRKRNQLDVKRKNFQIAVNQINQSLEYIFYAKNRLVLELGEDHFYHLRCRGQAVKPEQISCGERNALALSYFFTEVTRNTDTRRLYQDEVLLVIDDPVSSFDMENRIGILSFLRLKLDQMLTGCATTKILIMTHDISVLLDLDKALGEILKGKQNYSLFRLQDKQLVKFPNDKHSKYNEYTALIQQVYHYARNPEPSLDLVIGNMMRRVLEAFSSFSYKIGVTNIGTKSEVLALLPNEASRIYFQNSMYRLVVHGESHFEDAVRSAPETTFFSTLSDAEKQRTARDILCLIYQLNKLHLLKHLPQGAQKDLDNWWRAIQTTFVTP